MSGLLKGGLNQLAWVEQSLIDVELVTHVAVLARAGLKMGVMMTNSTTTTFCTAPVVIDTTFGSHQSCFPRFDTR